MLYDAPEHQWPTAGLRALLDHAKHPEPQQSIVSAVFYGMSSLANCSRSIEGAYLPFEEADGQRLSPFFAQAMLPRLGLEPESTPAKQFQALLLRDLHNMLNRTGEIYASSNVYLLLERDGGISCQADIPGMKRRSSHVMPAVSYKAA